MITGSEADDVWQEMMEFRGNIVLSAVAHATLFVMALTITGRDAASRVPERYVAVRLFEEAAGRKPTAPSTGKEDLPKKAVKKVTRRRRSVPPEVPLPAMAQQEAPAVVQPEQNRPLRQVAVPADQGPFEKDNTSSSKQAGEAGRSGMSPAAVQLAIPGKTAPQGDLEGRGDGTSAGNPDAVNAIRAAIERAKSYPLFARRRGLEGTVTAEFTISAKGYPENIRIVRSSGHDILDSAAKKTLLRASPFPAVKGRLEVPITFRLER